MNTPSPTLPAASHPHLLLVDGSSYLYRAFHALPDLRGPQGMPTGAIHGMVSMLTRLRDQFPATLAACVFDAKGPTFRNEWYADYKGHRPPMPEDLARQIEPIHELVKLLGWPVLEVAGVEADDVIGTLSRVASEAQQSVMVSTGDKDLAQLVNEHVTLINTMSNESLNVAGVLEKFGVPPDRIIDYLTLMGDAVDNVPGVEKVGPKTAAKWVQEYGSLDGVMAAADSIKGKAGENLRAALNWLPLGRRLITVRQDCDLSEHIAGWPDLSVLHFAPVNQEGLLDFYTRYGFKTFKKELENRMGISSTASSSTVSSLPQHNASPQSGLFDEPEPPAPLTSTHYTTITTPDQLSQLIADLNAAPWVALDTETNSLDPMQARIVGLSFSTQAGTGCYIPLAHQSMEAVEQLPIDETLARLRPWLENPSAKKIGQNIKYDIHVFENHGVLVKGYVHDTLLESYVYEAHKPHALESLAQRHLGRSGISYEDLCGKGAQQIPFAQVSIDRATAYSAEDSDQTLHVHQVLWPRLESDAKLRWVYEHLEMPTALVLQRIERYGVLIDSQALQKQSQQLAQRMLELEAQAHELAGGPFNLGSPKQIGDILFNRMGIKPIKKTASGAPSTDEDVLETLAADYPLPAKILEYRSLSKLKGTYTDKLPLMVNPQTGRVHTNYAQAVAVTGRLSSNDPNLQNIPIRTAEGRRIREAFVAPPDHVIASADYSQIELRIMAHLSGDPVLLKAFAEGQDVHRATAAEIFSLEPEAVSSEQRRYAKVINFGLIYGMGAFGLASNLGIEQKAAKDYIDRYFTRFAGVKRYMDQTRELAKAQGYVETVFGRRLWLPEIRSPNGPRQKGAERQAINAPMQGTAADLIKLAMIAVQQAIDNEQRATRMVMQVHDELVFEVPQAEVEWVKTEVPRLMAQVASLQVPLLAEIGFGQNWEEAH